MGLQGDIRQKCSYQEIQGQFSCPWIQSTAWGRLLL